MFGYPDWYVHAVEELEDDYHEGNISGNEYQWRMNELDDDLKMWEMK